MSATIIIGGAWGDEGKGKVASYEASDARLVIRATGGANAGHTIVFNNRGERHKIALHLIPGGIVYPQVRGLIGQGVVIDPKLLIEEVEKLEEIGIPFVRSRLRIAGRAHVVLPYHKELDELKERLKDNPIGTTKRGIGPAYEDKKARTGIRVYDLLLPVEELEKKIEVATRPHYQLFKDNGMEDRIVSPKVLAEQYSQYGKVIKNMVINADILTEEVCKNGDKIVVEGAQAYRLDNDYGDYPDVTSSNCVTAGALIGAHISHKCVDKVIVVAKAHCSRVGNGVFPTEQLAHIENDKVTEYDQPFVGDVIREICGEYGATTGRPRRCGWGDAILLKSACSQAVTGADYICLSHMDSIGKVGNILGSIKLCTAYRYQGKKIYFYPDDMELTGEVPEPVYTEFAGGWDIPNTLRDFDMLPEKAKQYIKIIEDIVGIPVKYIGVGPNNNDVIVRDDV